MCDCPEAQRWRAYWSAEAIAARLREETELYRRICHERWAKAIRDVRQEARNGNGVIGNGASYAELERRRAE